MDNKEDDKLIAWLTDQRTKSEFLHQKLHEYGLLDVAYKIEDIKGEDLEWVGEDLGITDRAWKKVIHRGIKPVVVFAHPSVISTVPRAISYYRGLAMVSQKSMKNIKLNVDNYEQKYDPKFPNEEKTLELSKRLNILISGLIEADEEINSREFDLWRGMTAGFQADGSWKNKKGDVAEQIIKDIVRNRLYSKDLVQNSNNAGTKFELKDGRVLELSSEPDISISNDGVIETAVEIKGGIDKAGVLERVGAAIKSLHRAKEENIESNTILIMYEISMTAKAAQELEIHRDDINHFYGFEQITDSEDARINLFSILGI